MANCRKLLLVLLVAFASVVSISLNVSANTLIVDNGILMGADDVLVDGNLYDVEFVLGSFDQVFSNGNGGYALAFTTASSAAAASQALLDYVFVDTIIQQSLLGFDSNPLLTFGVGRGEGIAVTPFRLYTGPTLEFIDGKVAINDDIEDNDRVSNTQIPHNYETADILTYDTGWVWARWTEATNPVPEPGTMLLFGVGLVSLAGVTRRKLKK